MDRSHSDEREHGIHDYGQEKRIGLRGAAKYLKWWVEGANTNFSVVLPCRLLGIVVKLVWQEEVTWKAPPHTVVSIPRKMLRNLTVLLDAPHSG